MVRPGYDRSGGEHAVDDPLGGLADAHAVRHRLLLEEPPRVLLAHPVLVHQPAFGTVDDLARLEPRPAVLDLALERRELREPADGDLDRRHQIALLERLDEI